MYCKHKRLKGINREMVSDVYDDNRLDDYEEYERTGGHQYISGGHLYDTISDNNNVEMDVNHEYLEMTNKYTHKRYETVCYERTDRHSYLEIHPN